MAKPRILILGAGPTGLVLATALARRGNADVSVVEREPNPFECPTTTDRSYTIDITGHGLRAIRYLGLVDAFDRSLIRFAGIQVHRPIRKIQGWEEKGWTGSRGDILKTLLQSLEELYPGEVKFLWETKVEALNVVEGHAII